MRKLPVFYTSAFLAAFLVTANLYAQPDLHVLRSGSSLYLQHKVEPRETWYSLGRLYNLSPKEIAPFNGLDINKGLSIGQLVKVPLLPSNFSQLNRKGGDEVLVPVYYRVKEGEWMFRVSTNNNKVPIEQLEKWNGINRNQVKAGMDLVVGHLKVKPELSALAAVNTRAVAVNPKAPVTPPKETTPIPSRDSEKKQPAIQAPATVVTRQDNNTSTSLPEIDFKGGYFKKQFSGGSRNHSGVANIFRSTSGWKDGKYYALMDNVPVGTIILVINSATNKSVYAKVLGNLSDIRENSGLAIRISNAAAAELGAGENRFNAMIKY